MTYILSFDDFCEDKFQGSSFDRVDLLFRLKSKLPQLKVNLFTILGKSSINWIREIQKISWIDMIPHGWNHSAGECAKWSRGDALHYLEIIRPFNLTKGFKAPGWRISFDTYDVLLETNYWVADLFRNKSNRPSNLRSYDLIEASHTCIQGHMARVRGDDGLEKRFDYYSSLTGYPFLFIKDFV